MVLVGQLINYLSFPSYTIFRTGFLIVMASMKKLTLAFMSGFPDKFFFYTIAP